MATRKLEVQLVGNSADLNRALGSASKQVGLFQRSLGAKVGAAVFKGAAAGAVGAGAALVGAVKASATFEKQMSSLKAVTDASGKTMDAFKKQAIDAGIKTSFSAKEAAVAQTELAKGGLSVKNIMGGGLSSALALAAAGNMELGDAAATTANAMNLFGLEGKDAGRIADGLAMAANATTADVSDFGMALAAGGSVAKSVGLSFTETTVALEALAASGIKNSDAGTSLKSALIALVKPSDQQAKAAKNANLEFKDQHGKMKSLTAISAMLRKELGDKTAAERTATLATIAGTDGVRTLTSLYDAGPAKLDKFRDGLNKQGTAAKVAATMQDNLAGKFEQFKGTLETIAIVVGDKVRPTVQKVVEALTGFANGLMTGEGAGGKFRDVVVDVFTKVKGVVLDVVGNVRDFIQQFEEGRGKAVAIAAVLVGFAAGAVAVQVVGAATRAWAAAQLAVNAAMAMNPIGLIVIGLVALGAGLVLAYKKSEMFRNIVNGAFSAVKTVVASVVSWLKGAVDTVVNEVSQWKLLFTVVAVAWKAAFAVIKGYITVAVGAWIGAFKVAMAILGPIVSGAWGGIKQVISGALNVIKGVVKIFGGVLKGDFGQIWDGVKQVFSGAWGVMKGTVRTALGAVVGYVKAVPGRLLRGLGDLTTTLLSAGEDIVGGLLTGIRNKAGEIVTTIKDTITDKIPGKVKKFLGIESPSKVMAALGRQTGEGFIVGLASTAASIGEATKKALLFPLDAAITALNAKKDELQKAWDAIDARAQRSALVAATHAKAVVATANTKTSSLGGSAGSGVLGGGKFLQGMGLQVGESKYFGGVTTDRHKHYPNDHYSGNSIDVNAAGGGAGELSKLQAALTKLRAKFRDSIQQAMIEDAGSANQHLHVTFKSAGSAAKAAAATVKAATSKVNAKVTGKLTANQMRGLLYAEGFRGHDLDTAVAIAFAESGGNTKATNKNKNGSIDRGFMQINSVHGALSTFDAKGNAAAAKKIFDDAGGSFSPWATFNSGAYKKFTGDTGSGKGSTSGGAKGAAAKTKGDVADAVKALKEFDKAAARANKLAKIEAQVKNLEQLKAFKDAIKGVRDRLADMATQAAAAWRQLREGEIDKAHEAAIAALAGTDQAKELAAIEQTQKDEARAKTEEGLAKDLADAKASGDTVAIKAAEDAIADYKREQRAEELRLWLANETAKADAAQATAKDGLDAEEATYKTSLQARFDALAANLEAGKISYASFATSVQGELDKLHLPPGIPGFAGDSGEEATINAGGGVAGGIGGGAVSIGGVLVNQAAYASGALLDALLHPKKRAAGGPVKAGYPYRVGEFGMETFVPDTDGNIVPNGGGRGGIYIDQRGAHIGSSRAARVQANQLAMRVAFG